MSAKKFGPFTNLELVGKNAVRLDLPCHLKIHDVVNEMRTAPYSEQPTEIAAPIVPRPDPIPTVQGNKYVVDEILTHPKRSRGYQFLTLMRGDPTHDAEW